MDKTLFCVIGPSGSGKSTYVKYAIDKLGYGEIISTTSRLPRMGEINGKDYHFVSREQFESLEMIQRDEYAGNYYGTAKKDLDYAFSSCPYAFMVITYESSQFFKHMFKEKNMNIDVVTVFVNTPIEELEKRMINRGDDPLKIKERIENIRQRKEYENKDKVDYVFNVDTHASIEQVCEAFVTFLLDINKGKEKR